MEGATITLMPILGLNNIIIYCFIHKINVN